MFGFKILPRPNGSRFVLSYELITSIKSRSFLCLLCALLLLCFTSNASSETSEPCEFYSTINVSSGKRNADQSWYHEGVYYPASYYATYNYILDENATRIQVEPHVRGCICLVRYCLRTCCAPGQLINFSNGDGDGECREDGYKVVPWKVGIENPETIDLISEYHWVEIRPSCKAHFLTPRDVPTDAWVLLRNSSIYMTEDQVLLEEGKYCVALDETDKKELIVLKCIEEAEAEARFVLFPIGMFLSVPFLLATFIVYACIPELRNVHGKSLMSYVLGLTVGYTILASVQFHGNQEECRDGSTNCFTNVVCVILGYIIYFSFMVSFFWLNVMCFDIFWTFRGVRGNIGPNHNFKYYCLYAWGVPIFLTVFANIMQHANILPEEFRPNIGNDTCFFNPKYLWSEFLYLYLILIILICCNILFFVITAFRIKKVQQETSAITSQGASAKHTRHNYEKYRFWLYLRLFVVMGVSWSLEVISWAVNANTYWFYVTDLYNCIQGILIFFLVVWNEKVKKLAIKRLNKFRGIADAETHASFRTTTISTSMNSRKANNSIQLEQGKLI